MTKILSVLALVATFAVEARAEQCPVFAVAKYKLNQHYFTWGTDMTVTRKGLDVGKVLERKMQFGVVFELFGGNGVKVARAERSILSWGTEIKIYDCNDVTVGTLKQHVFNSLFKPYSVYSIFDGSDRLVAQSEKVEVLGTTIRFFDGEHRLQARLEKWWLKVFRYTWTVKFEPESTIDPRVLLVTAAFKTSADSASSSWFKISVGK